MRKMRRREFITCLGSASVAWPLAARAQQQTMPAIGFVGNPQLPLIRENFASMVRGLAETGYVEGRNVAVEYPPAEYSSWPARAAYLVDRKVAVLVGFATPPVLAAKAAT